MNELELSGLQLKAGDHVRLSGGWYELIALHRHILYFGRNAWQWNVRLLTPDAAPRGETFFQDIKYQVRREVCK